MFIGSIVFAFLPGFSLVDVKDVTSDWTANESVQRFILAIGLAGLLLGLWGACAVARKHGDHPAVFFLVALLAQVWLFHVAIRPSWLVIPYGLRYYVSDLTPLTLLFAGATIPWLARSVSKALWRPWLVGILALCVLAPTLVLMPFLVHYEAMHKTYNDLQALASRVEPDAVVLIDSTQPMRAFQPALTTVFGIESHTVDEAHASRLAEWLERQQRPVYLLGQYGRRQFGDIPLRPTWKSAITVTEVAQLGHYRHLKLDWSDWAGGFTLYTLAPTNPAAANRPPVRPTSIPPESP
jgi:hypothetical protein